MGDPGSLEQQRAPAVLVCEVGPRDGLQIEPRRAPGVGAREARRAARGGLPRGRGREPRARGPWSRRWPPPRRSCELRRRRRRTAGAARLQRARPRPRASGGGAAIHVAHPSPTIRAAQPGTPARGQPRAQRAPIEAHGPTVAGDVRILCGVLRLPVRGRGRPGRVAQRAARSTPPVRADRARGHDRRRHAAGVRAVLGAVGEATGVELGLHLHNTRNAGYANAARGSGSGDRRFDASVGGFGGCPFAPLATGNVATEDLAWILEREGAVTASTSTRSAPPPSGSAGSSDGRHRGCCTARARFPASRLAAGP